MDDTSDEAQPTVSPEHAQDSSRRPKLRSLPSLVMGLVDAIRSGDDLGVEDAVIRLSGRRRIFAPLGMVVGAFMMLFEGLRLVLTNWRLLLIQMLPAMWIWVVLLDLKAHVFYGKSFRTFNGWHFWVLLLLATLITAASMYLNAIFAFAVARKGKPDIPHGFAQANVHRVPVLTSGAVIGLMLGVSAFWVPRYGHPWFAISMSVVAGIMMFAYVAVPARLIGVSNTLPRTEKLKTSAVGGAIGALVCAPPYMLGRLGILMLGSKALFVPGVVLLSLGVALQVGATSSVKAVKMSAKLLAGSHPAAAG